MTVASPETKHIGSGHSVSEPQNGEPSSAVEYVYRLFSSRALKMWSEIIKPGIAEIVARDRQVDDLVGGQERDPLVEPHASRTRV